ncbi:hypothetical protein P691DRAFT_712788 [Macrolepiota fuliginosa MF-IS2]|uniref:Nephrocystin 3-like N-terminal domain-containing protein n=1 Tax=Macrolepiota fuliginosa MF-IS2 TaxID=1400762 RepID=A0A9P6BX93_9AGAR|nr:hypothetical protein P691DRAFT_712788 [Macrolepiota fuliginosa MF-IS2]
MPSKRITKILQTKGPPDTNRAGGASTNPEIENFVSDGWNNVALLPPQVTSSRLLGARAFDRAYVPIHLPDDVFSGSAMTDAGLHSTARFPPPRCHLNTRKSLRARIIHWGTNAERESRMLWIMGSAGAGKSALAQSLAEEFKGLGILGAALFFSRSNHRDDPDRIIATLAYQLCFREPYANIVAHFVRDDPMLMKKDRTTQFKHLIIQSTNIFMITIPQRVEDPEYGQSTHITVERPSPSITINTQVLLGPKPPLVVFLDGLDECRSEEAQCEFIDLICAQVRQTYSLLWIICSRPEPHLERAFRKAEAEGLCWVEELRIDDPEAQSDVERYLRDEFERIARKYQDDLGEDTWPPKDIFDKIVGASSGHFLFATTLIRYLDQSHSTPRSQLSAIVAAIDGVPLPSGVTNPLAYIDNLYLEVLNRLDERIRSEALELLAICMACPPLPVLCLSQLLQTDVSTILDTLFSLHSIISVPYDENLVEEPLRFYHASFTDFLTNPDRSGIFSQRDLSAHRYRIIEACFHVLASSRTSYANGLIWDSSRFSAANPSNLSVFHGLLTFAATHVWDICTRIRDPKLGFVRSTVAGFDYRLLKSVGNAVPPQQFVKFLQWLYSVTKDIPALSTFVRTSAQSDLDFQFIKYCAWVSQPLDMDLEYRGEEVENIPRYALVGFGEKTALILVIPDCVMIYSIEEIGDV